MLLVIARDAIKYWKGELYLFKNRRESTSHVFHKKDRDIFDDTYSFIYSLILFFYFPFFSFHPPSLFSFFPFFTPLSYHC